MNIEFLNPPQLCPTFGWTHVVSTTGGTTIHISGQVGINERGEVVGGRDLKAQTGLSRWIRKFVRNMCGFRTRVSASG
jgi:enamine deaminase RidA (YjgF/YER057c/UK114 family)